MVIKKTTTAKKSAAKKTTVTKKPTTVKKTVSKPSVIVETKKTNKLMDCSTCRCGNILPLVGFVLIALTFVFSLFNLFKKDGAWKLEEIKVGGAQNMAKVMEFYNSDMYIEQQTMAIDQALEQVNMMNNMTEEEMYNLMNMQMDEEIEFDVEDLE